MAAVGFEVEQVVEDVDGGGAERKEERGQKAQENGRPVLQLVCKKQRDQDQGVLDPLMNAQCADQ